MDVRMPASFSRPMTSVRKPALPMVSQPWSLVSWPGSSGTRVTCSGRLVQNDRQEFFVRISLDVQLGGDGPFQGGDVVVAGVALVRPRVNGDALGPEPFTVEGHADQVGVVGSPAVADEGDFIEVDGKVGGHGRG